MMVIFVGIWSIYYGVHQLIFETPVLKLVREFLENGMVARVFLGLASEKH